MMINLRFSLLFMSLLFNIRGFVVKRVKLHSTQSNFGETSTLLKDILSKSDNSQLRTKKINKENDMIEKIGINRNTDGKQVFGGVKFPPPISTALNRLKIINTPSPIQKVGIPAICSGLSCVLHAATGTGKTYTYLLPALKRLYENDSQLRKPLQILIVVPTRELVDQISDDIMKLTDYQYPDLIFTCKNNLTDIELSKRNQCPIWIGTSFKVNDFIEDKLVGNLFRNIEYFILDEVDRLIFAPSKYATRLEKKTYQTKNSKDLPTKSIINHLIKSKCILTDSEQYRIEEFQVVAASATVGRPLRRELFHLFNVNELKEVKDDRLRGYNGLFPVVRPLPTAGDPVQLNSEENLDDDDEEDSLDEYEDEDMNEEEMGEDGEGTLKQKKQKRVRSLESNRAITIPSSIKHYLLIDPDEDEEYEEKAKSRKEERENSRRQYNPRRDWGGNRRFDQKKDDKESNDPPKFNLPRKLSLVNHEYLANEKYLWSKVLIFVPKVDDVVQALFILKRWKIGHVTSLTSMIERLEKHPNEMVASANLDKLFSPELLDTSISEDRIKNREIIVIPFSGTRGLHIPNVDTVFILKPPRTMDEYLHISGRTGRLQHGGSDDEWMPIEERESRSLYDLTDRRNKESRVVTVTSMHDYRRLLSWQNPLKIKFKWLMDEEEENN